MTTVDSRLRAVAHALTEAVPDSAVRPLHLPPARRHSGPSAWLAPLAATMVMIAVITLMAKVAGPHSTFSGNPGFSESQAWSVWQYSPQRASQRKSYIANEIAQSHHKNSASPNASPGCIVNVAIRKVCSGARIV